MAPLSSRDTQPDHLPSTPTGPSKTHVTQPLPALDTRPQQPETFFDDTTPVDTRTSEGNPHAALRDSHDLSFGDGTRNSVVDNMLLSLDQLPLSSYPAALFSNFDNDNLFFADNSYSPAKPSRHRGHTYTSSQSSDYDLHADESTSRFQSHNPRGRRSNSSNNIPNAMSRRESLRGTWPEAKHANDHVPQTGHMRGGVKGSKSSAASSVDFTKGTTGAYRAGLGRRSISFDHGNMTSRTMPTKAESILERSRATHAGYHPDYEAAPQPTIPAGPRRIQEAQVQAQGPVLYNAQPPYAPLQAPVPRRKNSVRSTASFRTLRKNKSHQEPNMRLQAQEFVNAANLRDLPPIPTYQEPPAPSPTVATRKHTLVPLAPVPEPKEKPGFFRRMFGGGLPKSMPQLSNSSTNSNVSHVAASPASLSQRPAEIDSVYSSGRPRTTPHGSNHIASQLKSPTPRPPQTASSAQTKSQQLPPPALAKKHSSFFRRRKKSVTESPQPPAMPLQFQTAQRLEDAQPQPSPGISSLRKVMNPYLGDVESPGKQYQASGEAGQADGDRTDVEGQNGFSPGYKPHRDATVRSVKPGSREAEQEAGREGHAASTSNAKLKLKLKTRKPNVATAQEDTFLADSSSCNDEGSGRATPSGELGGFGDAGETRRAASSPTAPDFPLPPSGGEQTAPSHAPGTEERATPSRKTSTSRSRRVWLKPSSSEESLAVDDMDDDDHDLALPMEGARPSQKRFEREKALPATPQEYTPASTSAHPPGDSTASLPTLQLQVENENRSSEAMPAIVEHRVRDAAPSDADRERALRIFSGDDPSVQKGTAAAELGDVAPASLRTRKAFMDLFDWAGFNILGAMRDLCGKIVLKAETQQVDRILMALSERWCECNPTHGFKAIGKCYASVKRPC